MGAGLYLVMAFPYRPFLFYNEGTSRLIYSLHTVKYRDNLSQGVIPDIIMFARVLVQLDNMHPMEQGSAYYQDIRH